MRIPTPKKIPPSLKEYSVGQLPKDYLPIITTTTTTTTTYTHLILATLSFYFWPMPIFFCRMPNFMRPELEGPNHQLGGRVMVHMYLCMFSSMLCVCVCM